VIGTTAPGSLHLDSRSGWARGPGVPKEMIAPKEDFRLRSAREPSREGPVPSSKIDGWPHPIRGHRYLVHQQPGLRPSGAAERPPCFSCSSSKAAPWRTERGGRDSSTGRGWRAGCDERSTPILDEWAGHQDFPSVVGGTLGGRDGCGFADGPAGRGCLKLPVSRSCPPPTIPSV